MSDEQLDPAGATSVSSGAPESQGPAEDSPVTAAAPPSRRAALMRSGLIVGVLVVVFGLIIPQFIDYNDVVDAFKALTLDQFLVITALGALAWVVSGLIFSALIDGLSWIRGAMSWLILAGIGASVPFGPWNMGVLWVVVRGWGVGNAPATSGVALYGVINILSRMFLPLFGIVALAIGGDLASRQERRDRVDDHDRQCGGLRGRDRAHRRDRALRADRRLDRPDRPARHRLDHAPARPDRRARTSPGRSTASAISSASSSAAAASLALSIAVVAQFVWAVVLLVALRVCGVPAARLLSGSEVFGVYALVMCITIIPLSPGGAGVSEILFISAFTTIAGTGYEAAITAGVFLYRMYFWFVPDPAGVAADEGRPAREADPADDVRAARLREGRACLTKGRQPSGSAYGSSAPDRAPNCARTWTKPRRKPGSPALAVGGRRRDDRGAGETPARRCTMLVAVWHPIPCPAGIRMAFAMHLHGRDAEVTVAEGAHTWHWRVLSPAGHLLAEGDAPDREAAELAAEGEVGSVHPPTDHLIDELVG